jgi:hypothetical protein
MSSKQTYYDKRSDFWRHYWDLAKNYDEFLLESDSSHIKRWEENESRMPKLTDEQASRLQGYDRKLNILMYGGVWCFDCSRIGPTLKEIADAAGAKVCLRIINMEVSKELQDELRILGALRVPVVVFLSEDFWEVARVGDRLLTVYRAKAYREVGRGTPSGILGPRALSAELEEWVDMVERVLIMLRLAPPLRARYDD